MALYQFCAKRKGGNFHRVQHILGEAKHDLQILDLISMQFNTKEELMTYLGLSLDEFDDIAITYKSNGTPQKLEVILSDAPELEDILCSMVDFGPLEEYDDINVELALAYTQPSMVKVSSEVNRDTWGFKRINNVLLAEPGRAQGAFNVHLLHRHALDYHNNGQDLAFANEITKTYLPIRKIYDYLRSRGYLKPSSRLKPKVSTDLSTNLRELESKKSESNYNKIIMLLMHIETNDYEDFLIDKIMKGDNEALEQLMLLDARELEKFQEFLALLPSYLGELARRRKTLDND